MPHSDLHKKKLKKNLVLAGLIFLFCALIWAVTMIKTAKAEESGDNQWPETIVDAGTAHTERPGDIEKMFGEQRKQHLSTTKTTDNNMKAQRKQHLKEHENTPEQWWADWIGNRN